MSLLRAQKIYESAAGEQAQGTPLWLVTFTDLIAILVIFFVLLFSLSSVKPEIWAAMRAKPNKVVAEENAEDQSGPWVAEPRVMGIGVDQVPPPAQNLLYLATVIEQQMAQLAAHLAAQGEQSPWVPAPDIGTDSVSLFLPDAHVFGRPGAAPGLSPQGQQIVASLARVLAYSGNYVDVVASAAAEKPADWRAILARGETLRQGLRDAGYLARTGIYGRYGAQTPGIKIFVHSYGSRDRNG